MFVSHLNICPTTVAYSKLAILGFDSKESGAAVKG